MKEFNFYKYKMIQSYKIVVKKAKIFQFDGRESKRKGRKFAYW